MLLNIVKLRYADALFWLGVTSINGVRNVRTGPVHR
jgi:hypothetical protein